MERIYNIFINLIVFVPVIAIFIILPFITRKDIMFGVTIPQSEWKNDDFKKMRKNYVVSSFSLGVVFVVLSFICAAYLSEKQSAIFLQVLIWSAMIVYFLLFLYFWSKTRKYKANADWQIEAKNIAVADTSVGYSNRSLSPAWFLTYGVIIAATFFSALQLYDLAPNMIPTRFDMQGNPVLYQPKSMKLIYQIVGMQAGMGALFTAITVLIRRAKKTIDPNNPKISSFQNDLMKYRWSIFLYITGLLMLLIFSVIMFSMFITMPMWVILFMPVVFTLIILVYAIVLAIKTGQSGNRIKTVENRKTGEKITRDDDKHWKLGVFYYNKDDPAVFVEKRFGAGWTNNFAKWQSWLIIAAIIAIVVVSLVFSF